MATLKQIEANRRNAHLSTGPRTIEGKSAARFNSLKSGIHAAEQVIPGENHEAFESFARELTESCNPVGAREQQLVDQMIAHGWRLRRLFKAEPQGWSRNFRELEHFVAFTEDVQLAASFDYSHQFFLRLQRLIASVQKSYQQASTALDRLQSQRAKSQPQSNAQPIAEQPLNQEIGFVPPICISDAAEAREADPASEAGIPAVPESEASPLAASRQSAPPVPDPAREAGIPPVPESEASPLSASRQSPPPVPTPPRRP